MQVYVQKSIRTTFPRRSAVASGRELSHPVAPSSEANSPSMGKSTVVVSDMGTPSLPQRPERRSDLLGEDLRLLPGGEVSAPGGLVVVGEVRVAGLDPAARGLPNLAGERAEAHHRELDRRGRLPGRGGRRPGLSVLPV